MIGLIALILAVVALIIIVYKQFKGQLRVSPKFLLIGILLAGSSYFFCYYGIVLLCGKGVDPSYCETQGQLSGLNLGLPVGFALFGWITLWVDYQRGKK
ncbi:MAG: hypothetical protein AB8G15_01915 [Saprospiraceae bacterium]